MRRKKLFFIFNFSFLFFIFYFLFLPKAMAAFFTLDPQTDSVDQNQTFNVQLKINTEGQEVTSADAVLIFDQDILEATNAISGEFFPQHFKNISSSKVYVGGAVETGTQFKNGEGLLSTITFKGKGSGTTVLRFDCTPAKTSDSNISKNDKLATDLLDCTKLVNGTYTIGGGQSSFQPTCTPSPTGKLPEAGVVTPSIFLLAIGSLLTFLGVLFRL